MLGHEGGGDGRGGGGAWREMVVVGVEEERGGRRGRRVLSRPPRVRFSKHSESRLLDPNQTAAKFYTEI